MRPSLLLAAILFANPLFASPAFGAPTKADVAEAKADWKLEKSRAKDITKIVKAWTKAHDKDKLDKMHDADAELLVWRREMIEDLRDDGVRTGDVSEGTESGAPAKEALRDLLVQLRDEQAKFDEERATKPEYKAKAKLLAEIVSEAEKREGRHEMIYDRKKDAMKAARKAK